MTYDTKYISLYLEYSHCRNSTFNVYFYLLLKKPPFDSYTLS